MKSNKKNDTYVFYTLDHKNVSAALSKIDAYFKKNGRTVIGG